MFGTPNNDWFDSTGRTMSEKTKKLSESLENYLETIYLLTQEKRVARSKDIAEHLKVNRSSVTGALQALRDRELVNYEPYGYITLTKVGATAAKRVLRRHVALRTFFVDVLAIGEKEADEVACRMEHGISKHVVDRLIEFAEFVETCPRAGATWVEGFGYRCEATPPSPEKCEDCVKECLREVERTGGRQQPERH
jgi:DtxR family Mn-dependent transcriptional regulator